MRNVIVLGCGRSGTSAAAGAIIRGNPHYYSGGEFVPPRVSNPDGTFESISIRSINEDILSNVVPARPHEHDSNYFHIPKRWQRWLARIPLDKPIIATKTQEQEILRQVQKTPFCLKDPRFSYTLSAWKPFIPKTTFVCMFRHPAETARSILRFVDEFELMKEFKINYEKSLEAWFCLNEHILEKHFKKGDSWLFMHLDQLYSPDGLNKLANVIGGKINTESIKPERKRTFVSTSVPKKIQNLYDRLCELAEFPN